MYLVEVNGNVIVRGGSQHSCETILVGGQPLNQMRIETLKNDYTPRSFNGKKRKVEGNLFLSETRRYIPYATYLIHGDEIIDERAKSGDLWVDGGVRASYAYWRESMEQIEEVMREDIPAVCQRALYNGLFVECFSALELLLCNIALSFIYANDAFFERAVDYWKEKEGAEEETLEDKEDLEFVVHNFFSQSITYHRFGRINTMYHKAFDFELPNHEALDQHLYRRHNIVHRHSVSNLDWMSFTDATVEDVRDLIRCVKEFGDELEKKAMIAWDSGVNVGE